MNTWTIPTIKNPEKFEQVIDFLAANPKCSREDLCTMIGALPWHEVERAKKLVKIVEEGYG